MNNMLPFITQTVQTITWQQNMQDWIVAIAGALVAGLVAIIGVYVYTMKTAIPRRVSLAISEREQDLKDRQEERELEKTRETAAIDQTNKLISALTEMFRSFTIANDRAFQQSVANSQVLIGHTHAVTGMSESVEGLQHEFAELTTQIETLIINSQKSVASSEAANTNSRLASELAQRTLNELQKFKHDLDEHAKHCKGNDDEQAIVQHPS